MGAVQSAINSFNNILHIVQIVAIGLGAACALCTCGCLVYKVRKIKRTFTQEAHEKTTARLQKASLAVQLEEKRELSALVHELRDARLGQQAPAGPPPAYQWPAPTFTRGYSKSHEKGATHDSAEPGLPLDERLRRAKDDGERAAILLTTVPEERARIVRLLAEKEDPHGARKQV